MAHASWLFTALSFGAVLLAATPSEARAALLREGCHPPVFALPDSMGKPHALQSYLGARRIVLLFGPSKAYLKTLQSERVQLEDRDLTVLVVVPTAGPATKEAHAGPVHFLIDHDGHVAQKYGVAGGKPAFYLIGKDGHIALTRHGDPPPQELYGVIDAMPMRRREMQERHR